MIRAFLTAVLLILSVAQAQAETINADSCSYAHVNAAVGSASRGDTVVVPACESTSWDTTLTITVGITLQGAGIGSTTIQSAVASSSYLIRYAPATPANDDAFTLTGFTFDINDASHWLWLDNSGQTAQTKIRIHHNSVTNVPIAYPPMMLVDGPMFGVVDNNSFDGSPHIDNYGQNSCDDWAAGSPAFALGGANNLYFEDNDWTTDNTATTGGHGGRYVFRYNTFNASGSPWFDMHGNQGGGVIGPRGGEIYGNIIGTSPFFISHRGGEMVIFYNKMAGTSATGYVREEYSDASDCSGAYDFHVKNSYYWNNKDAGGLVPLQSIIATGTATGGGDNYMDGSGWPSGAQAFCNTYCPVFYVLKITGGTGAGQSRLIAEGGVGTTRITVASNWDTNPSSDSTYEIESDCCDAIAEDTDFFNQQASFDGTTGMGCGTLASRPATCTEGVGYWVPVEADAATCTTIPATIAAMKSAIQDGTLYKCTSENTWTAYYTPYTYPHPLRGETATISGVTISGATIQ